MWPWLNYLWWLTYALGLHRHWASSVVVPYLNYWWWPCLTSHYLATGMHRSSWLRVVCWNKGLFQWGSKFGFWIDMVRPSSSRLIHGNEPPRGQCECGLGCRELVWFQSSYEILDISSIRYMGYFGNLAGTLIVLYAIIGLDIISVNVLTCKGLMNFPNLQIDLKESLSYIVQS